MKTSLFLASVLLVFGCMVVLGAHVVGLILFNVTALPTLIGGSTASALLGQLFSDYSRRPRFRVRRTRPKHTGSHTSAAAATRSLPTLWTYTTHQA